MVDYFSETSSALYIRIAVVLAVVIGIAAIVLAVSAREVVAWWAGVEGVLVLALAYGLWRRSLAAAIALLLLKTMGAVMVTIQTGQLPGLMGMVPILVFAFAAAAIHLGPPMRQATIAAVDRPEPEASNEEQGPQQ